MRLGAVTPSYMNEGTIAGTINCLKDIVDKHIVLISEKPYFGETEPPDRTEEICRELGVDVIKGVWKLDHLQRSRGNSLCMDCDWVFGFDSDEMMEKKEIEKLIKFAEKTNAKAIAVQPENYWKTIDYVFRPKADYTPIIMMRPEVRFPYIRNIDCRYVVADVTMHHLSWAYPKNIHRCVLTYAHASDFDGEKWYQEHYKDWKVGEKIHDPHGGVWDAFYQPLPKELRGYLGVE
jgi:hypothetical protein